MKNEIVLFTDGDINLEVELSPKLETVWLTQKQMEEKVKGDEQYADYYKTNQRHQSVHRSSRTIINFSYAH